MDSRVIPEVESDEQPFRTPEQELWYAVLLNSVNDGFFASDWQIRASESAAGNRKFDAEITRGDARRFLTMKWGPWAESRERICAAAGVDSELLAQACRKKLALVRADDEKRDSETINKARERVNSMLENLVAKADTIQPSQFERQLQRIAEIELETL